MSGADDRDDGVRELDRLFHAHVDGELDDAGRARRNLFEPRQRLVEREQIQIRLVKQLRHLRQRRLIGSAFAIEKLCCPRAINQQPSHLPRGDDEKMRLFFPFDHRCAEQPQISFVDQIGWLQRLRMAFLTEVMLRQPVQVVIDQPDQVFTGFRVSFAPLAQES